MVNLGVLPAVIIYCTERNCPVAVGLSFLLLTSDLTFTGLDIYRTKASSNRNWHKSTKKETVSSKYLFYHCAWSFNELLLINFYVPKFGSFLSRSHSLHCHSSAREKQFCLMQQIYLQRIYIVFLSLFRHTLKFSSLLYLFPVWCLN